MKTLVIGYKDAAGLSGGEVIAGPAIPGADQHALVHKAKREHIFPAGIKRVEMYLLDQPTEIAEYISDDVTDSIANGQQTRLKLAEASRARVQLVSKRDQFIAAARKIFDAAARKRNEAIGAVAAQRNLLSAVGLPEKDKPGILKKIKDLQPKAEAAIAEFKTVLAQFEIVRNPKSEPEAIEEALTKIGVKEPPKA